MRFDHLPPLWLERDAELYGRNLTSTEFAAELDDLPPRLRLLPSGGSGPAGRRVHAATGTRPALTLTVAPTHRTRPAATLPSSAAGPDFPEAA